jgi:hypothetical protein
VQLHPPLSLTKLNSSYTGPILGFMHFDVHMCPRQDPISHRVCRWSGFHRKVLLGDKWWNDWKCCLYTPFQVRQLMDQMLLSSLNFHLAPTHWAQVPWCSPS